MSPGRSALHSGTKISRPAELKVLGTGSKKKKKKNSPSESLGLMVVESFPVLLLWFLDPWILSIGETILHTGCWFKAYIDCWQRLLPPNWNCNYVLKKSFRHYISRPAAPELALSSYWSKRELPEPGGGNGKVRYRWPRQRLKEALRTLMSSLEIT